MGPSFFEAFEHYHTDYGESFFESFRYALVTSFGSAFLLFLYIAMIALPVLTIIGTWKYFQKMGHKGWECLIPYYSNYVLFKELYGNGWRFLLLLLPVYNIYVLFRLYIDLAHAFNKSTGFGVGLTLLPFIFGMILGLDDSTYQQGKAGGKDPALRLMQWLETHVFRHAGQITKKFAVILLMVSLLLAVLTFVVTVFLSLYLFNISFNWGSPNPLVLLYPLLVLCALPVALVPTLFYAIPVYAFGQLVDDIHQTSKNTRSGAASIDELPDL